MKKTFLHFAKSVTPSDFPLAENQVEEGGGGNAEVSGANEQADASRGTDLSEGGSKLFSGDPKPSWYDANKDQDAIEQIKNVSKIGDQPE